jgi:proteic killer suppression protein
LEVRYKSNQLERVCTNADIAQYKYGPQMAEKISQRIVELAAADSVQTLLKFGVGRCHPLKGDRKLQYAMDLVQPFRLVFEVKNGSVYLAKVMEIVDYH